MPNRKTHQAAGGTAGSILAGIWAAHRSGTVHPSIVAGGLLGGLIGARMPDIADPPDSPNHRGTGHSIAFGGTVAAGCSASIPILIDNARRAEQEANAYIERGYRVPLLIGLRLHLALAALGFTIGVPAGVASHLVLDSETPDGIRVLNRKI